MKNLTENEKRLLNALKNVMGNIDFTNHCCDPFSPVAACLPVEVLDDANALIKELDSE